MDGGEFAFPVSFAQQRLWFLDQLLPGNIFYNIPSALRLKTALNVSALRRSLNEIVRRHESLRTTFSVADGKPVQLVAPELELELPVVDLRDIPPAEREGEAHRLASAEAQAPFDLARGPLLRAALLQLAEADYILLLVMHHIVTDGWSMGVLFRELSTLYNAFVMGRPSPLPELPIQYADYAVWQRQWLDGEVRQRQVDYWKEQLADLPVLELPTDRPRPVVQSFRGAQHPVRIEPALAAGLKQLSQREGVTLFMTLLAAFQTLLARYTGQDDIVVGSPIAGRNRAELEPLIGFFVNTLVLRTDLSGDPSFVELLRRVRQVAMGAYAHQDLPFEMLVEELHPERDLSRNPLFQVNFHLLNTPAVTSSNREQFTLNIERNAAIFDLAINLREANGAIEGHIEYNTDLFEAATVERIAQHFARLLEGVVANAHSKLSQLPLLTEAERTQLLFEWNQTQAEYPREVCVHELFELQAERAPGATAIVSGDQRVSYAELNIRANQLAHYLTQLGVGPEVLVGVYLERSIDMVVALLAVLKAGGAYIPLDPSYSGQRLSLMLDDAQPRVIVTRAQSAAELTGTAAIVSVDAVSVDAVSEEVAGRPSDNPSPRARPDNLAYVIYTSGSTGTPKGILIPHRAVTNYLSWCARAYPLGLGEGAPVHSSIAFDLTITSLFAPLVAGRAIHLVPDCGGVDALAAMLLAVRNFSLVKLTPAHLHLLSAQIPCEEAAGLTGAFIIGGEGLSADAVAFWREHAPHTLLVNEYGPSETVVGCCVYRVTPETPHFGAVPIGRPIANTRLYILDRHLQPVPVGVTGELYIGGDGVARGYLNRPDLTGERFLADPFINDPGARIYKSGDLARFRSDGVIEYLGRSDRQVKIRGFRIEPGEVESFLRQYPAIQDAVVMAREDVPGDCRLVAYVTPADVDPAAVRSFARGRLPDYMTPSAIVPLPSLPLTRNGKIDERALPVPERQRLGVAEYVAPTTPVEEVMAAIWADVLRVQQVGVNDDFFSALGGHSLIATQVLSRIRETLNIDLPLRTLFEAPTVAGMALKIADDPARAATAIKAAELLLMLEQLPESEAEKMLSARGM